jgi:putative phosphoribosyl transferase
MHFHDRRDAGRKLAEVLTGLPYPDQAAVLDRTVLLALPRGGVPVGFEVACAFHLPLDILIVRKLGVPGQEELAMGAITSGGIAVLNSEIVRALHVPEETIASVIARERLEMERQESIYRDVRPQLVIEGRPVILVDDGLATGASMRAAVRAVRGRASQVTIAVPVGADDACHWLASETDRVVCAVVSKDLGAVGAYYRDFTPTSDEEVRALLAEARERCVRL